MTRRRALWLVVTLLTLAALSLLIPASPAYLPDLVSQGYFGVYDFDLTHGVVVKDYLADASLWEPAAVPAGVG